jgi:hypothetical protein
MIKKDACGDKRFCVENYKKVFFACIFADLYGIRTDSTTLEEVDHTFLP